jgi:hypothetical protein
MSDSVELPSGDDYILRVLYTSKEANGVRVLTVASCISLIAVCGLLAAIALSAFNTRKSTDKNLFVRTHVAAYFLSVLVCDLLQAVGSIMNQKWVQDMEVLVGHFCTIQGAVKQTSDVGSALFTLILAIHTFFVLFLRWQVKPYVLWLTLLSAWSAVMAIVIAGPAVLDTTRRGPFFGISGYWCWITEPYAVEHLTLDYMFMFMSALFSFILYTLVFLRLRGNIVVSGWYVVFHKANTAKNASWRGRDFADNQAMAIAKQMLLYPVAYTLIILPIAAARFSSFAGHPVPFSVTIFCDTIFLLSGTVNVILFTTTRRILPPRSIIPSRFTISQPKLVQTTVHADPEAYYGNDSTEKKIEDSTSIFKRTDSYISDNGSDFSLPNEHHEEALRHLPELPYVQTPATARPNLHQSVRHSGESMYDMYAESTFRRSEMPHNHVDHEYREAQEHYPPERSFSNVPLDD